MDREMLAAAIHIWSGSRGDGSRAEEVTESEKNDDEEEFYLAVNAIL